MYKTVTWRYPWIDPATLPKDPPLPEPYPGYSMMEMLEREHRGESSTRRPSNKDSRRW